MKRMKRKQVELLGLTASISNVMGTSLSLLRMSAITAASCTDPICKQWNNN
jgi:hypothetical protein